MSRTTRSAALACARSERSCSHVLSARSLLVFSREIVSVAFVSCACSASNSPGSGVTVSTLLCASSCAFLASSTWALSFSLS